MKGLLEKALNMRSRAHNEYLEAKKKADQAELEFQDHLAQKNPCPRCGGVQTAEMGRNGPYIFCIACGLGGED